MDKKWIIAIIIFGYAVGGWLIFSSGSDKLDYKAMDAKGVPHSLMDNMYKSCMEDGVKNGTKKRKVKELCICHANSIVEALSKEEFVTLNNRVMTRSPLDPEIDAKIKKSAQDCNSKVSGN